MLWTGCIDLLFLILGTASLSRSQLHGTRPTDPWIFDDIYTGIKLRATFEHYSAAWAPYSQVESMLRECRGKFNADVIKDPKAVDQQFGCESSHNNMLLEFEPTGSTPLVTVPYHPIPTFFTVSTHFIGLWHDMGYVPSVEFLFQYFFDIRGAKQLYQWRGSLTNRKHLPVGFVNGSTLPNVGHLNLDLKNGSTVEALS